MAKQEDQNNPLMAVGHYFTSTLQNDTYAAIDPIQFNLNGKRVFVNGASRGIGLAIALSFAKAGASHIALGARSDLSSVVAAIHDTAAAASRPAPKVLALKLDVTSEDSIKAAAATVASSFGAIDVLINNAGVFETPTNIADSDPATWWWTWQVNVLGPFLVTRACLPLLLKGDHERGRQIVNVSSVGAWCVSPGLSAYQTSKLAVLRVTDFVNAEVGGEGIVAFCVHPGNVLTDMVGGKDAEFALKHLFIDTPELCADTIVFLTEEKRKWLAGRYISCTWNMPELMAKEDEIVQGDKLKITMSV